MFQPIYFPNASSVGSDAFKVRYVTLKMNSNRTTAGGMLNGGAVSLRAAETKGYYFLGMEPAPESTGEAPPKAQGAVLAKLSREELEELRDRCVKLLAED
jgi:hypothetical protein